MSSAGVLAQVALPRASWAHWARYRARAPPRGHPAEHIRERIGQFGGKLYLEFGGKLFDDYHASRVLPGFQPDSKFRCCCS